MTEKSVPFQHIIDNPLNMQRDDGPASFVGFQEEAVVGVVVKEILRQGCGSVQAVGKPVSGRLATGGVAGPAAGGHPLLAVACSVGVDGD